MSILFLLLAITPETHLLIIEGEGAAVPWQISFPRAAGIAPLLLPRIDIDSTGPEGQREGEFLFILLPVSPQNWNSPHNCYPLQPPRD